MSVVSVRPAAWGDRKAVGQLIAAMGSHEDVLSSPDPLRTFGEVLSQPSARALVADLDQRVVGYAELQARPSTLHDGVEGWLGALAVDPALPRSGAGARLMEAVEHEARLLGCDEIVLESSVWRTSAHSFYLKAGFRQETPAERFRRPPAPAPDQESRFLALAARAANRVASALARWIGVQTVDRAADLAAEAAALEALAPLQVPVLTEEGGWSATAAPCRGGWICLDALDGSANLRAGLPPWAFSAALVREGQSVAGLVCDLASGRRWWASRGRGAWVDGRPASPRRVGLVAAGSRADALHELPAWVERVRIPGSTSLSLCHVASGSLGGYRGLAAGNVRPQDVAAAAVILSEAGACLVDSSRSPLLISPHPERLQIVAAPDFASARDLLT